MNLIDLLTSSQNSGAIGQLASQFGLGQDQAKDAVRNLVPALSRGLQKNTQSPEGLTALLNALNKGNHQRYIENPTELARPEAQQEGNGILGHILGSKDVSRNVAGYASQQTGIDQGILKKMLPMVASMVMGGMSKQVGAQAGGGGLGGLIGQLSGGGQQKSQGLLGSLLDADKDGSVADDLLDMAKKFF